MKKQDFKKHMMYKNGKGVMANTYEEHLALKKKGYDHTKPKSFTQAVESRLKSKKKY
tara:strand:- start:1575 stop:1745 length:171 start_codon:yes stop_codon:yes gene_type:complete